MFINAINTIRRSLERPFTRLAAILLFALVVPGIFPPSETLAEPLDYCFATMGFKAIGSRMHGRMGFKQQIVSDGTLNDLQQDLGLPRDTRTFEVDLSLRPLEHHVVRLFGRFPEYYAGSTVTPRELRTRNTVYPAGTLISSNMRTAQYGVGYDLDFLIGPRWFGGLNLDLRYIDFKVRMGNAASGEEDTIAIDEATPCFGAHLTTRFPFGLGPVLPGSRLGGYTRMSFGIMPNYLNYSDLSAGLALLVGPLTLPVELEARFGYQHESIFQSQENTSSRVLEFKRDGLFFSLDLAY